VTFQERAQKIGWDYGKMSSANQSMSHNWDLTKQLHNNTLFIQKVLLNRCIRTIKLQRSLWLWTSACI